MLSSRFFLYAVLATSSFLSLSTDAFLVPANPSFVHYPNANAAVASSSKEGRYTSELFAKKYGDREMKNNMNIKNLMYNEKSHEQVFQRRKVVEESPSAMKQQNQISATKSMLKAGLSGIFAASLIFDFNSPLLYNLGEISNLNSDNTHTIAKVSNDHWTANAKGVKRIKNGPIVTLPSGVQYQEMSIGEGASPSLGDRVAVHYSLFCNGFEVESTRDSSGLAARPYGFNWGSDNGFGSFPKAVQEGMKGMQIGGRRKITVPAKLAYGEKGRPPFIPPNSDVLFDISIWSIKPAGVNPNLTLSGQQNYF